jgi:hypothetical protein
MSFIRKKTIKGNDYFYEVESIRDGDKVRQKVIKYLGTTKPTIEPKTKIKEKPMEKKKELGTTKRKEIEKKKELSDISKYPKMALEYGDLDIFDIGNKLGVKNITNKEWSDNIGNFPVEVMVQRISDIREGKKPEDLNKLEKKYYDYSTEGQKMHEKWISINKGKNAITITGKTFNVKEDLKKNGYKWDGVEWRKKTIDNVKNEYTTISRIIRKNKLSMNVEKQDISRKEGRKLGKEVSKITHDRLLVFGVTD